MNWWNDNQKPTLLYHFWNDFALAESLFALCERCLFRCCDALEVVVIAGAAVLDSSGRQDDRSQHERSDYDDSDCLDESLIFLHL